MRCSSHWSHESITRDSPPFPCVIVLTKIDLPSILDLIQYGDRSMPHRFINNKIRLSKKFF